MSRLAGIVVFAGAVVLSTRILAPAKPTPLPRIVSAADLAAQIDQATPLLTQMNAQVEKLRERLAAPPSYPPPARDPFRFAAPVEPRPKRTAPVAETPVVPAPAPAPVLPRLIAITSNVVDGSTVRTAVLATGDQLHLMKVGDKILKLEIRSIAIDAVELADPESGATFRIALQ